MLWGWQDFSLFVCNNNILCEKSCVMQLYCGAGLDYWTLVLIEFYSVCCESSRCIVRLAGLDYWTLLLIAPSMSGLQLNALGWVLWHWSKFTNYHWTGAPEWWPGSQLDLDDSDHHCSHPKSWCRVQLGWFNDSSTNASWNSCLHVCWNLFHDGPLKSFHIYNHDTFTQRANREIPQWPTSVVVTYHPPFPNPFIAYRS